MPGESIYDAVTDIRPDDPARIRRGGGLVPDKVTGRQRGDMATRSANSFMALPLPDQQTGNGATDAGFSGESREIEGGFDFG